MSFEVSGVDHDRCLFAVTTGQTDHHLRKDTFIAPAWSAPAEVGRVAKVVEI